MTTATLRFPASLPETRATAGKGLLARFYAALIEARMRAAMREIAMHRHLIPEDVLKKSGYAATVMQDGAYPFTRQG
jgi:hypothetical protein